MGKKINIRSYNLFDEKDSVRFEKITTALHNDKISYDVVKVNASPVKYDIHVNCSFGQLQLLKMNYHEYL